MARTEADVEAAGVDDGICPTCDTNPVRANGECGTCGEYRRRKGVQRPARLARRQPDLNRRRFEDRLARRR